MARHSKSKMFSSHSRSAINARTRKIIIGVASVLLLLLFLIIVGYFQLMAYLQGNDFRQKLTDTARAASGAKNVELASNLSINGSRVALDGFTLSSMGNVEIARVGRISTDIDRAALFSRQLHVRKLSMEEAALFINTSAATPPAKAVKKKKTQAAPAPQSSSAPAAKSSPLSGGISLDLFECKDADIHLLNNGKKYQLLGANVTAVPAPKIGRHAWQITAENARLHTPFAFLRDSSIKSTTVVYHDQNIDVTDCRVMLTPGELRLKAHYGLKKKNWTLDMQVNKGDIHRILNDDWRKRLSGDLYGRMVITGKGGEFSTGSGSFFIQNGVLEALPFLSQLPMGNTYPYRSIELEKADCQILFPYNSGKIKPAWLFDKINLQAKDGLLIVRGYVLLGINKMLAGSLKIGVPKALFNALPIKTEALTGQLFTAEGDEPGYLWVNMNISGTLDNPQEDLSVRVAALAGQSLGKLLNKVATGSASELLNTLLQQPATDTEEQAEDDSSTPQHPSPIDDAANAAGTLLQSLF